MSGDTLDELLKNEKEFISQFIVQWRAEKCLWKRNDKNYKNKRARDVGYQQLVDFMKRKYRNPDREDVANLIQKMRIAFRKEMSNYVLCHHRNQEFESSLWYFDLLVFTLDQEEISSLHSTSNQGETSTNELSVRPDNAENSCENESNYLGISDTANEVNTSISSQYSIIAETETNDKTATISETSTRDKPATIAETETDAKTATVSETETRNKTATTAKTETRDKTATVAETDTRIKTERTAETETRNITATITELETMVKIDPINGTETTDRTATIAESKTTDRTATIAEIKTSDRTETETTEVTKTKQKTMTTDKTGNTRRESGSVQPIQDIASSTEVTKAEERRSEHASDSELEIIEPSISAYVAPTTRKAHVRYTKQEKICHNFGKMVGERLAKMPKKKMGKKRDQIEELLFDSDSD